MRLVFCAKLKSSETWLAHSQHDLVDGSSWEQTIEMAEWIENGVHASDLLEQLASSYAVRYEDGLWASA
jgi:hypothetical protein